MNFKRMLKRYMNQAGDGGSAGGAPTPTPTPAPAPDGGAQTPPPTPTPTPTPTPASLLATGGQPGEPGSTDYIPDKLRVMKEDGTLDTDASSRKLADAYSALEKKMGTPGEAPPKTAAEYTVTVPDALKEAFDPATDVGMQGFLSGAHEQGMTQKQVDFVMGKYFEMAPQLAAGAAEYDVQTATTELKKTWATDADFKRNIQNAYAATNAAAQKAGLDVDDIMSGPLRNHPQFLRLMAALGPEFQEDPGVGGMSMVTQDDVNTLMASEAYSNSRHPDHAKVSAKVKAYFERKHGLDPVG